MKHKLPSNCFSVNFAKFLRAVLFFYQYFLSETLAIPRTAGEERRLFLFHSVTSRHLQTFRRLFATLQVRWLSQIFNRIDSVYQTFEIYHLVQLPFDWLMMQCLFFQLFTRWFDSRLNSSFTHYLRTTASMIHWEVKMSSPNLIIHSFCLWEPVKLDSRLAVLKIFLIFRVYCT